MIRYKKLLILFFLLIACQNIALAETDGAKISQLQLRTISQTDNSNTEADKDNSVTQEQASETGNDASVQDPAVNTPQNPPSKITIPVPQLNQGENILKIVKKSFTQPKVSDDKSKTEIKKEPEKPRDLKTLVKYLIAKSYLTTVLAILGLFGTFLGLFSTWLIYHLSKKYNDPFIRDKKDSAIKYIEELHIIKDLMPIDKYRRLDSFLNMSLSGNINEANNELNVLISILSKSIQAINERPIIETHNRYKKHMKARKAEIFNAFIADFKMLNLDDSLKRSSILTESEMRYWKNKVLLALSFYDRTNNTLKLLYKELKK